MKKHLEKLALIILGVMIAFIAAEIALRAFGYSRPFLYMYDDEKGWSLRPEFEGLQKDEGKALIKTNSEGFRDREHALAARKNTIRIAIIGDSYAEASQVPMEKTFWSVIEKELNSSGALKGAVAEVMNFGVRGYGTTQEFITLRDNALKYRPDIVVLAFYPENDLVENSRALNTKAKCTPFFVLNRGKLSIDASFNKQQIFGVKRGALLNIYLYAGYYSRLLQILDVDRIYKAYRDRLRKERPDKPSEKFSDIVLFKESYTEPKNDAVRNAWTLTESIINEINRQAGDRGAKLLVVTLSAPIQVFPDANFRQAFMKSISANNLFYGDNRIKQFCAKNGIDAINLAALLQPAADRDKTYFHGFQNTAMGTGHWNEEGHKAAGQIIAKQISAMLKSGKITKFNHIH